MLLHPWSHTSSAGFTLRGWHSTPSGKPLLHFLHGNGFCGRAYEPLLRHLAEPFDLWISDAQGHGDSDHGGRFVGWNRSAELAVEAFEAGRGAFGEVPRYALGHSFGGVLSSLILARQPALFQRAVLLDPVLFTPNMLRLKQVLGALGLYDRLNDKAKRARARRNHWADADEARNRLRGRGIFKNWDEAALTAYVDNAMKPHPEGGLQLKCHPEREAEVFSTAPQGLWRALRQVRTPSTLIYGQDSYPFVLDSARRLPRLNPQVQARAVEGGHCFMQERPQATARLVQDYLLGN